MHNLINLLQNKVFSIKLESNDNKYWLSYTRFTDSGNLQKGDIYGDNLPEIFAKLDAQLDNM